MLDDEGFRKTCRENVAAVVPELRWSEAVQPLLEFCRAPRRAPDLADPEMARELQRRLSHLPGRPGGLRGELSIAMEHMRAGGPAKVARKAWGRAAVHWGRVEHSQSPGRGRQLQRRRPTMACLESLLASDWPAEAPRGGAGRQRPSRRGGRAVRAELPAVSG